MHLSALGFARSTAIASLMLSRRRPHGQQRPCPRTRIRGWWRTEPISGQVLTYPISHGVCASAQGRR